MLGKLGRAIHQAYDTTLGRLGRAIDEKQKRTHNQVLDDADELLDIVTGGKASDYRIAKVNDPVFRVTTYYDDLPPEDEENPSTDGNENSSDNNGLTKVRIKASPLTPHFFQRKYYVRKEGGNGNGKAQTRTFVSYAGGQFLEPLKNLDDAVKAVDSYLKGHARWTDDSDQLRFQRLVKKNGHVSSWLVKRKGHEERELVDFPEQDGTKNRGSWANFLVTKEDGSSMWISLDKKPLSYWELTLHDPVFNNKDSVALNGFLFNGKNGTLKADEGASHKPSVPAYAATDDALSKADGETGNNGSPRAHHKTGTKKMYFELFRDPYRERDDDLRRLYKVVPSAKRYLSYVIWGSFWANAANASIVSSILNNALHAGTITFINQIVTQSIANEGEAHEMDYSEDMILSRIPESIIGNKVDGLSHMPRWKAWETIEEEVLTNICEHDRTSYEDELRSKIRGIDEILRLDDKGMNERKLIAIYSILGYDGRRTDHLDTTIHYLRPRLEIVEELLDDIVNGGLFKETTDVLGIRRTVRELILNSLMPGGAIPEARTLQDEMNRELKEEARKLEHEELDEIVKSSFSRFSKCMIQGAGIQSMSYGMWLASLLGNPGFGFWAPMFAAKSGLSGYNSGMSARVSQNYFFEVYGHMIERAGLTVGVARQKVNAAANARSRDGAKYGSIAGILPKILKAFFPLYGPIFDAITYSIATLAGFGIAYRYLAQYRIWRREGTSLDTDNYRSICERGRNGNGPGYVRLLPLD